MLKSIQHRAQVIDQQSVKFEQCVLHKIKISVSLHSETEVLAQIFGSEDGNYSEMAIQNILVSNKCGDLRNKWYHRVTQSFT